MDTIANNVKLLDLAIHAAGRQCSQPRTGQGYRRTQRAGTVASGVGRGTTVYRQPRLQRER